MALYKRPERTSSYIKNLTISSDWIEKHISQWRFEVIQFFNQLVMTVDFTVLRNTFSKHPCLGEFPGFIMMSYQELVDLDGIVKITVGQQRVTEQFYSIVAKVYVMETYQRTIR